jgi:hypothetical protein
MTDREKFNEWLKACPVTVVNNESWASGTVEVLFKIEDEDDDRIHDEFSRPSAKKQAEVQRIFDKMGGLNDENAN